MQITKNEMVAILQPTIDIAKKADWSNKRFYANWVAQTYYIVNHSTRLFALAAAKTPLTNNDFHNRFLKHMTEEKGHENLARTDLKNLGYTIESFPELSSTAALYQTQYYWIHQVSAYAFFGYLMALEGLAATVAQDVRVILSKNHDAGAIKFIKVHSEEDLEHIEEVFQWLQKMPESELQHVKVNLMNCSKNYGNMLNEIFSSVSDLKQVS